MRIFVIITKISENMKIQWFIFHTDGENMKIQRIYFPISAQKL